ncbi:hypothetical protein J2Z31_001556 [Sinorhizobium kostiense]|uniref:Transcriptional regulator n=1 Tax=Sinorhizobium kostiense TaxID=76747 RepID=A0ABS4QYB5_9HYPH|nr:hypothetical protein [Sinorhizobium kostiense]MBP2235064.1 hypothetical protein [Sinorhizobium kostiense]
MKPAKTTGSKQPAADLVAKYRPLGLRAVLAAALQVKRKPASPKKVKRTV